MGDSTKIQRRIRDGVSEEELIDHEVEDALAATPEERMAAAVTLLDTVFAQWASRENAGDEGLCRIPAITQQRRRGLCRDRGMAVISHIPYRTTRDFDVLIEPTLENGEKVRSAVREWGEFEPDFTPQDFVSGDILSFGGLLRRSPF